MVNLLLVMFKQWTVENAKSGERTMWGSMKMDSPYQVNIYRMYQQLNSHATLHNECSFKKCKCTIHLSSIWVNIISVFHTWQISVLFITLHTRNIISIFHWTETVGVASQFHSLPQRIHDNYTVHPWTFIWNKLMNKWE